MSANKQREKAALISAPPEPAITDREAAGNEGDGRKNEEVTHEDDGGKASVQSSDSPVSTQRKEKTKKRHDSARHPWDESETELLLALRARGEAYVKLRQKFFPKWNSDVGLLQKLQKAKKEPRWAARFEEVKAMDKGDQLAVIVRAEAAVARARRQRSAQEQEKFDDLHSADEGERTDSQQALGDAFYAEEGRSTSEAEEDNANDGNNLKRPSSVTCAKPASSHEDTEDDLPVAWKPMRRLNRAVRTTVKSRGTEE